MTKLLVKAILSFFIMFPKISGAKQVIYLDHAATTPLSPLVKKAMEPFLNGSYGNPSSLYQKGREAKVAIDDARKKIAQIINARPSEIIFTAGGTESVNLAIFGTARKYAESNAELRGTKPHLIASAIEHHCVINSFIALAGEGYKTTLVDVDSNGFIDLKKLQSSVRKETVLISVMLANNEIGTVEPIAEIGKWLKRLNLEREKRGLGRIFLHSDACQAAGTLDINVDKLGVDLVSINGSKIYGPKQTGFLYVRSGVKLKPLVYGGGQENGLRSGTENVAGVVGLAKALEITQNNKLRNLEIKKLQRLQANLVKRIKAKIPNVLLNGPEPISLKGRNNYHSKQKTYMDRLPNNINFTIKGVEGEALVIYLDSYGISTSTASACSTGLLDPSHVLLAIGRTEQEAKSSIRLTLGKSTTTKQINYLLKILPPLVKELRKIN